MTTETPPPIPAGSRAAAQGRLVPESIIPDHLLLRDDLVRELTQACTETSAQLAELKAQLLSRVAEHIALIAQEYDADITGRTGDVRLDSYDGRWRVERVSSQRTEVGEQIHAAEQLVRSYLAEETAGASDGVRAIVDRSFRRNPKTGELNVSRLMDFVAIEIDDKRWQEAQRAIRAALQSAGSVTYFRAYHRAEPDQNWRQILLDFSSIPPASQEADGGDA